jgi:hypothetical protein
VALRVGAEVSEPLLLTEEEAASLLLMHPRTLRKLRQAGAIRYVAVTGRKIAYRPEDCEAFVQERSRLETPQEATLRGRARPRRREGGNVLSFMARREARQQGRAG